MGASVAGPITVLVAASNYLVARGLAELIREVPNLTLMGTAQDSMAAFMALQAHHPSVLVLDLELAGALYRLMRPRHHLPRVLLMGSAQHIGTELPRIPTSACGFIRNRAPAPEIVGLLHVIARCDIQRAGITHRCVECPAQISMLLPKLPLSEREYEVFVCIGNGERPSDMAAKLGVSVKTVETHRENVKRKLGLHSSHALVTAAIAWRSGDFTVDAADPWGANA